MRIVRRIADVRAAVRDARSAGAVVGLVPTMGAFHEGHLSLIRQARAESELVVVSLFVNPTQFGANEDLCAYPRDEERDAALAAAAGADILFVPPVDEIYPDGFATTIHVSGITEVLCGAQRGPRHFDGVATVVAKLFQIVAPDAAYFGQKDAQQILVIRRLVRDLDIPVRIVACPIVREADGLAMSSRNVYLDPAARERATALNRALDAAEATVAAARRARGRCSMPRGRCSRHPESNRSISNCAPPTTCANSTPSTARRCSPSPRASDRRASSTTESWRRRHEHPTTHPCRAAARARAVTIASLAAQKANGEPIAMVTAYDYPSAQIAEAAGVDVVLVGDSAAMTVLGHESTVPVTVDEMLMLTAAVRRGLSTPLLVADLPFGSYEVSDEQAVATAQRFIKTTGCDAVKIERGGSSVDRARAIIAAGIPVMGHVGLTPQTASTIGGYRSQGRTAEEALAVCESALALQAAGCFAIVFEAIPTAVTDAIMPRLSVPVIGIGAGPGTDGQVLVFHDIIGLYDGHAARFVKRYADLRADMIAAVSAYADEVRTREYPQPQHGYGMPAEEAARLRALLDAGTRRERSARSQRTRRRVYVRFVQGEHPRAD